VNLILIKGKVPRSILREPDIANAVLYKKDNRVFLIDMGATREMRKTLYQALKSFRLFDSFNLLNSHGIRTTRETTGSSEKSAATATTWTALGFPSP